MITLWGRKSAFNVQKVMWALAELGLTFEQIELGGDFKGLDSPEFRRMNPHRKVPVLRLDDEVVWESHSILRYLGSRFERSELWPVDVYERSQADRWMDWAQVQLQPAFMRLFWGFYRMPKEKRDDKKIKSALADCESCFDALNEHLKDHTWLSGRRFTLGAIPAGTTLYRYFEMGLKVKKPVAVNRWYEFMKTRTAYQKTVMVAFDSLLAKQNY